LRLGYDKVLETIGNSSLLQLVLSCVTSLCNQVIIVAANKQTIPQSIDHLKLRTVTDIYADKGPLGGIYSGLTASSSFYNLVVASDMPFLNRALIHHMIQLSGDFDLVVPRVDNLLEPLHAIYTKNCLTPIEHMIKQDRLSVNQLFSLVKVRYVESEEIERFDPNHLSFFNVNSKSDLEKARRLAGGCD